MYAMGKTNSFWKGGGRGKTGPTIAAGAKIVVYIHIGGATGLYSGDWNRKSDPYVNIFWGDVLVGKTTVLKDDANPVWSQTIEVGGGAAARRRHRTPSAQSDNNNSNNSSNNNNNNNNNDKPTLDAPSADRTQNKHRTAAAARRPPPFPAAARAFGSSLSLSAVRAPQFEITADEALKGGAGLRLEVFDKDVFSKDDFIGLVELDGRAVLAKVGCDAALYTGGGEDAANGNNPNANHAYDSGFSSDGVGDSEICQLRDQQRAALDAACTLGFAVLPSREHIHRCEAYWHLRKKQLESATASLVARKWCETGGTKRVCRRRLDGRRRSSQPASPPPFPPPPPPPPPPRRRLGGGGAVAERLLPDTPALTPADNEGVSPLCGPAVGPGAVRASRCGLSRRLRRVAASGGQPLRRTACAPRRAARRALRATRVDRA